MTLSIVSGVTNWPLAEEPVVVPISQAPTTAGVMQMGRPETLPNSHEQPVLALHLVNGEHYSGAERVQDLLARQLPQFGCEVGFACVKPRRFPTRARRRPHPWWRCRCVVGSTCGS